MAPVLMGLADAAVFDEFVSISGFVVIIIWSGLAAAAAGSEPGSKPSDLSRRSPGHGFRSRLIDASCTTAATKIRTALSAADGKR